MGVLLVTCHIVKRPQPCAPLELAQKGSADEWALSHMGVQARALSPFWEVMASAGSGSDRLCARPFFPPL